MNVKYINPVIESCKDILKQVLNVTFEKGRIYIKHGFVALKYVSISIGVTGKVTGYFYLHLSKETAIQIASTMMGGFEVTELDELSTSAISELCNMIAGHAGMYFSKENIAIDITPPDIIINRTKSKRNYISQAVCVPLKLSEGGLIDLDICLIDSMIK